MSAFPYPLHYHCLRHHHLERKKVSRGHSSWLQTEEDTLLGLRKHLNDLHYNDLKYEIESLWECNNVQLLSVHHKTCIKV